MSDTENEQLQALLGKAASEVHESDPGFAATLDGLSEALDSFVAQWQAAPAVGEFVTSAMELIASGKAPNFVATNLVDDEGNVLAVLTVRTFAGKTPLEFCADAARERDEARAEVERLRHEIAKAHEVAEGYAENHKGTGYDAETFRSGAECVAYALESWAERVLAGGEA